MGLLGGAGSDGGVAALEVEEVGSLVVGIVVLEMSGYPVVVAAKRVDAFFKFFLPASACRHGDFGAFHAARHIWDVDIQPYARG